MAKRVHARANERRFHVLGRAPPPPPLPSPSPRFSVHDSYIPHDFFSHSQHRSEHQSAEEIAQIAAGGSRTPGPGELRFLIPFVDVVDRLAVQAVSQLIKPAFMGEVAALITKNAWRTPDPGKLT